MFVTHTLSVDAATQRMMRIVEGMDPDDLRAVHNELFPAEPATEKEAYDDMAPLMKRIVDHVENGLEPEEVVDLWNVVFPGNRDVYFNELDDLLYFTEGESAAQSRN